MQLSDYAQALGAAQNLVPSYDEMRSNALAIQGQQLQNRAAQQELAAREQAQVQQQQLTGDLANLGTKATPENYRTMAVRYPSLFKPLSEAATAMEAGQRQQVVRDTAQIRATISAGKPEVGAQLVQRHIDADVAAGRQPDPEDQALLGMLKSGDQAQLKAASGMLYATLASFDPDSAAKNVADISEGDKAFTLGPGAKRFAADGSLIAAAPFAPQYRSVGEGESLVEVGGGDPASSGAAGGRGDTSRLINSDAGGGYVPAGVKTLGQFVGFGKSLNSRGAKSSSAGTYQINGTTMAEFGPRALGANWKDAPFNADSQERVGEAIFNWAKQQANPAAALRGRWVSLTPGEASQLVQGDWSQARGLIAQKETGGAPGASASAPAQSGARVIAQGAPKSQPVRMSPQEVAAEGLDPNTVYYRGANGVPQAVGGQTKASTGAKAVPDGVANKVDGQVEVRDTLQRLTRTFKKDYAGNLFGGLENAAQAVTGSVGTPGQRDWWSDFYTMDNQVRNQLFGAALSASEQAAYERTTVTPRMDPAQVQKNLTRRLNIVQGALARRRSFLKKNGYNPEAVDELFAGPNGSGSRTPAAPAASGFRILRVRPK